MKSKSEIQQELIARFGDNFNTVDNLITFVKEKYHPTLFSSIKDYVKTPYFNLHTDMTIDLYTDGYITENDKYIIVLFNDYRDFNNTKPEDKIFDDVVISYDKQTRRVAKYFYTSNFDINNNALEVIDTFYNN